MHIKKQHLPKVAKFQPKKITPSAEQLAIQLATQKIIIIDANAGAAKTTTLALRIAESLARGVPPEQMLALTITSAAQQVLQQRLKQIGVAAGVVNKIRCQTFESLAQQILLDIERTSIPYVLDQEQLMPVALDALQRVSALYGSQFALDMQTHNVAVHTFLMMQMRIKARLELLAHDFEGYSEEEIAHVLGVPLTIYLWHLQYENLRGVDEEIAFRGEGDAAYDLVQMLVPGSESIAYLPDYKVIIADELHDLNEVTFRLLNCLIQKSGAFFCGAGDKDQVIYSWRGADHQYLRHRFQATFPNLITYPLTLCYRHGSALAQAVAQFKQKKNESGVTFATRMKLRHYPPQAGAIATVNALKDYLAGGGEAEKCAILLRSASQSIQIERLLIDENIPYQTEGLPRFFHRTEILMLRGMMALGLRNMASVPVKAVQEKLFDAMVMFAEVELAPEEWTNWKQVRDTAISQANALDWFLDGMLIRRARHSKQAIIDCRDYLRSLAPDVPAFEVLQHLVQLLNLPAVTRRVFVDPQQASMVQESMTEFIEMCRVEGKGWQAFSGWLGKLEASLVQPRQKAALTLACIDDIKGKEYDAVFIPYLAQGQFPRRGVPLLEEENRFYVALTRTRLHLVLLAPEPPEPASPFVQRLLLQ